MRASTAYRKLFTQSTPKFRKVSVARFEFGIKHSLTLKINQIIFEKQFEKTRPWPDKNHMFSYVFQNYKTIFKYSGKAYLASAYR